LPDFFVDQVHDVAGLLQGGTLGQAYFQL
jgi:hypothetical protein